MFFSPVGGGYDPDVVAFLSATGITDNAIKNALNVMVLDLKSNNLWSKIYFLYPMVGGTSSTHSYNLRNILSYQLTFNGGWTHSSNGALPNGSDGYADTLFTPLGIVGQNNFGISYYSRTNSLSQVNGVIMGCAGSNSPLSACAISGIGATNTYWALNDYSFPLTASSGSLGLITSNRTGASICNYWRNTTKTNVNISSTNVPNRSIALGCNKSNVFQQLTSYQCALASAQQGFSDAEALTYYNIVQTFQTALSRQI